MNFTAALPADAQHDFSREEFDHHLPSAHRHSEAFPETEEPRRHEGMNMMRNEKTNEKRHFKHIKRKIIQRVGQ